MKQETKKQAIERLKEEGYEELYVVDCYITDCDSLSSTWLLNIYENLEDAMRWIDLCQDFYANSKNVKKYEDLTFIDKLGGYERSFSWQTSQAAMMERFKVTKVA